MIAPKTVKITVLATTKVAIKMWLSEKEKHRRIYGKWNCTSIISYISLRVYHRWEQN